MRGRYLYRATPFTPHEIMGRGEGLRPSVRAVLSLIDTTEPAWPSIAAVLREFAAAGIDLDETTVPLAVSLGRHRWGREDVAAVPGEQPTLASAGPVVYYIRRASLIKIGTTTSPRDRFMDLVPDEILAVEPGGHAEETRRHRQFAHLRCGGEYFRDEPELRDHARQLRAFHGDPDPGWRTSAVAALPRLVPSLPLAGSTETLTAAEAVTELGINEGTLRGWVHRGRLHMAGRDAKRRHVYYREHLILLRDSGRAWREAHPLTTSA